MCAGLDDLTAPRDRIDFRRAAAGIPCPEAPVAAHRRAASRSALFELPSQPGTRLGNLPASCMCQILIVAIHKQLGPAASSSGLQINARVLLCSLKKRLWSPAGVCEQRQPPMDIADGWFCSGEPHRARAGLDDCGLHRPSSTGCTRLGRVPRPVHLWCEFTPTSGMRPAHEPRHLTWLPACPRLHAVFEEQLSSSPRPRTVRHLCKCLWRHISRRPVWSCSQGHESILP